MIEFVPQVKPARLREQSFAEPVDLLPVISVSGTVAEPRSAETPTPVESPMQTEALETTEAYEMTAGNLVETGKPVPQQIAGKLEDAEIATVSVEAATEEKPLQQIDEAELEMLACVIYQEAGSDYISDETRYRVGDIVLNRIASDKYPGTMYGVLTERAQYGSYYWTGIKWPPRASQQEEAAAVQRAYDTARAILSDERHSDLYGQGYVFQAEFSQGRDVVYADGIYFGR